MSFKTYREGNLSFSLGNSKMGRIMSVSLPPAVSCDTSMPCFMRNHCYAMRHAYGLYSAVRESWNRNWIEWETNPSRYINSVRDAVAAVRPSLFRWHVGGDIPANMGDFGGRYIGAMCSIADMFPGTEFLCFTKRYEFVRRSAKCIRGTPNLSVVLSAWPGVRLDGRTRRAWPVCYVRDRKEPDPRIPADAFACRGGCDRCLACFRLKPGDSVVIQKH